LEAALTSIIVFQMVREIKLQQRNQQIRSPLPAFVVKLQQCEFLPSIMEPGALAWR
jgi:hypothetical protein